MSEYVSMLNIRTLSAGDKELALNFCCGNIFIDSFLRSQQALDDGFGKSYIWLEDDGSRIIGFYNISVGSIDYTDSDARYKMGGAAHINEFAIDQKYQGISAGDGKTDAHLSDLLLEDCIKRIMFIRDNHIGFSFVTLQSTKEGHSLYERNEFCEIESDMNISDVEGAEGKCTPMYLALDLE